MLIGEFAAQAGVRPSTIRYYERAGLLPEPSRTAGGYRDYGERQLEQVRFIRAAQGLGLRLEEISEILSIRGSGARPCPHVLAMLERRVLALSEQIAALRELRAELEGVIRRGEPLTSAPGDLCPVIEHGHGAMSSQHGALRTVHRAGVDLAPRYRL